MAVFVALIGIDLVVAGTDSVAAPAIEFAFDAEEAAALDLAEYVAILDGFIVSLVRVCRRGFACWCHDSSQGRNLLGIGCDGWAG